METVSSKNKDKRDKHSSSISHHSSKASKSSSSSSSRRHRDDRSSSGSPPPVSRRRHESSDDEEHESKRTKSSSSSSKHYDEKSSSHKKHRHEDEKDERKHSDRHKSDKLSSKKAEESSSAPSASSANGDVSLSIEETNALRAKLGLKPLTVSTENRAVVPDKDDKSGKKTYIDKDTNQEFEHAPAKNLARMKEEKELREKLQEQKEKRLLTQKITKAKGLADSDDEDEANDAQNWVKKLKEKEAAQRKAKLLEEMDEQFDSVANDAAVSTSTSFKKKKSGAEYTANHLKGLRVQHDEDFIKEGQEVILTLQDQYILKGIGNDMDVADDEDVLVNVNVLDQERAAKNLENLKNKPGYKPFDDGFDEDGNFIQRGLLDKYDEELQGEKKKSFKLGAAGTYDASDAKMIRELNEQHKARAIKLDILNDFKVASDYYSQQELEKFKKPKKIRKVLRSKKPLKADDLLPLPTSSSAVKSVKAEDFVKKEPTESAAKETTTNGGKKQISLKDIDFGLNAAATKSDNSEDDDDESGEEENGGDVDPEVAEELKEIIDEENNMLDELHTILNKTRQRITAASVQAAQKVVVKKELDTAEETTNGVAFDKLNTIVDEEENATDELRKGSTLVLDTMSEFCRNLGNEASTSKYMKDLDEDEEEDAKMVVDKKPSVRGRAKESDNDDEDDQEAASKEHSKNNQDVDMDQSSESGDDGEKDAENFDLLEDEPSIDRGLASALKLAVTKGFLVEEVEKKKNAKRPASSNKGGNIEAVNYMVEEKNYYDIDDKYKRNRDHFSGPVVDFDEKRNYKPDVKLDYIDEKGHSMNQKEAFRYLSHKFHGKGSGKKKTEKRQKKIQESEAMNKMSSGDTPLNTVALLREKQKTLQQPYVVLSTPKGKNDQVTLPKR